MTSVSLKSTWDWYQKSLSEQPLRTQMVTSGVLWSLGDMMAQFFIHDSRYQPRGSKSSHGAYRQTGGDSSSFGMHAIVTTGTRFDWRRVVTAGIFGAAFVAPTGHYWYQFLEYMCTKKLKYEPNSPWFVSTKLLADTILFGPLHLLAFFLYMGLAAGKPFVQVKQDIHRDYLPTLFAEALFWKCVQMANFRFVPVKHQLLFVNCFCLLDSALLAWIKHSDGIQWKHWMTTPKSLVGAVG